MSNERRIHLARLAAAACLGVVPALVAALALPGGLSAAGAGLPRPLRSLAGALGLVAVAAPALFVSLRGPGAFAAYPQIRSSAWDPGLWVRNALSWAVYLLAYEFFFRGFFLFILLPLVGAWPAIAVTTALYVFAHLHKEPTEALACVPMGVLFAAAALWSGSFWGPFFGHLCIALVSESLVVARDPDVSWTWGRG